jgi:hypothetical protein
MIFRGDSDLTGIKFAFNLEWVKNRPKCRGYFVRLKALLFLKTIPS